LETQLFQRPWVQFLSKTGHVMMKTLKNTSFCPILRQVGRSVNNRTQILLD